MREGANGETKVFSFEEAAALQLRAVNVIWGESIVTLERNERGIATICFPDGEVFGSLHIAGDITKQQIEAVQQIACVLNYMLELEEKATVDSLTGVWNRNGLYAELEQSQQQECGAVIFLDLDGFKGVNDRFGHEVGDQVLQEVAQRLKGIVREKDRVVRWGGDEFVLICPGLSEKQAIERKADMIVRTLADWELFGERVQLSASLGVAQYEGGMQGARKVVQEADKALYGAKGSGKQQFSLFEKQTEEQK